MAKEMSKRLTYHDKLLGGKLTAIRVLLGSSPGPFLIISYSSFSEGVVYHDRLLGKKPNWRSPGELPGATS